MYTMLIKDAYVCPWLDYVKKSLDGMGLSNIFLNQTEGCTFNWFRLAIKQRIQDMYKQDWVSEVMNNSQCTNYRMFKTQLGWKNILSLFLGHLLLIYLSLELEILFHQQDCMEIN